MTNERCRVTDSPERKLEQLARAGQAMRDHLVSTHVGHTLEQLARKWWEGLDTISESGEVVASLTALLSRVRDAALLEEHKLACSRCILVERGIKLAARWRCERGEQLERALASTATAEESK
jgi:hypothetical protein